MVSQLVLSILQYPMSTIPPLAALRAFEATVRLAGFARAAVELHVSTSAISHQIRGLEEALGARLLERSTGVGGIRVTPAGSRLLPAARDALSLLENALCRHPRNGEATDRLGQSVLLLHVAGPASGGVLRPPSGDAAQCDRP